MNILKKVENQLDFVLDYRNWYEFVHSMKTFHLLKFGTAGDEIFHETKIDWFSRKPDPNSDNYNLRSDLNLNFGQKIGMPSQNVSAAVSSVNEIMTTEEIVSGLHDSNRTNRESIRELNTTINNSNNTSDFINPLSLLNEYGDTLDLSSRLTRDIKKDI